MLKKKTQVAATLVSTVENSPCRWWQVLTHTCSAYLSVLNSFKNSTTHPARRIIVTSVASSGLLQQSVQLLQPTLHYGD
eukprot:2754248-Karenia_brevis.AAC.2